MWYSLSDQTKIYTTLDIFRSVRFTHSHVISKLSNTSLNAFYHTLKTDAYDHSVWNDVIVSKAVRAILDPLKAQPFFLSIDDTIIKKFGTYFEPCSKLYDHAGHNGSNYLNEQDIVSPCTPSLYTMRRNSFIFLSRWATSSVIRKKQTCFSC